MTLNLDFLSQYFTEVHFDKDALITRAGNVEHSLYYLSEGIVRFFYYNPTTDKETTVDILFAEQFFMSYASFVKREPSLFSIQALKEVTAYKIGREHLEHLIEQQEYLQIKALFKKFEEAAQEVEGIECWSARELQTLLGYSQWRNFELIIQKAKVSCSSVGENIAYHFADVSKTIPMPKGAEKQTDDLLLTR